MIGLIDTHVHLDMSPLSEDPDGAVRRADREGVRQIISIGINVHSSREAVRLAGRFPRVYASVGIHPHDAKSVTEEHYRELLRLSRDPKVVAWGEIGLDFAKEYSPAKLQKRVFRRQLALASEAGLPIIIHDRDAHDEMLEVLADTVAGQPIAGVVHCFSGDREVAGRVISLGLYISVTGIVTFPGAKELREVVRYLPLDRILIETDSPFLSPVPFRGKPNEPSRVVYVAKEIATIKGIPFSEVAQCTSNNARLLFGLPRL
ncbi:MAG TPA: TatD family deoxyribonuclease [Thermodesulfobacteriaceae bacterium]|nr:TatD family deoxyribonuclease [Thermodesulfobacteriaceae bacterium]